MAEKNRFQRDLEKIALKQIVTVILIGCLFFCLAVLGIIMAEKRMRREQHLTAVTAAFEEISQSVAAFLADRDVTEMFLDCVAGNLSGSQVQYWLANFNLEAPVGIQVILTDARENVVYASFPRGAMNLHRLEFNRISGENARAKGSGLYRTVYYIAGDSSEYVLARPLYEDGVYAGCATAYLKPEEWGRHFLKYQYDTILMCC